MKKNGCFLLACLVSLTSFSQAPGSIHSLDNFFADIPIKKSFAECLQYIKDHPDLGIDSINERGVYSSFKKGKKSHFPFPDSIEVKLLLSEILTIDTVAKVDIDTFKSVSVEGVFGNSKKARKDSRSYFDYLKKQLSLYYKTTTNDFDPYERGIGFKNGITENFPDMFLFKGYLTEPGFYYIVIVYEHRRKAKGKR